MGIGSSIIGGLGGTTTTSVKATTTAPTSTTSKISAALPVASAASSSSTTTTSSSVVASASSAVAGATVSNKFLILANDAGSAYTCSSGLNGYGIPYDSIVVPQTGFTLPALNSSATHGNYGGIIVYAEVAYNYGNNNWSSALTAAQWQQLYDYQVQFNVRMAQLSVFPGPNYGAAVVNSGCCNSGVEQLVSFTDVSDFATAGLKPNAGVSTQGLYHYPATITNTTTTKQIAAFAASSDGTYASNSVAAVINTFGARQQMAWFSGFDTTWSVTSTFVQHSWIHWMTRGVFSGRRRTLLNTQIDDVHLITDLYSPNGTQFRIRYQDLQNLIPWQASVNKRLPAGSNYIIELGHNGNGDIENATDSNAGAKACSPATAIEYPDQIDTALEFQKVLGTGTNIWPNTPTSYTWSLTCAKLDPLANWFTTASNLNGFAHISHTYTHMALNNATYADATREISFNQQWMKQIGISNAKLFSAKGLIPPAITGLHNGDAIRAWHDNGLTAVVGDNTRPILMNPINEYWPLITNLSTNGYDGFTVMPRWATTIYYNCDLPACTTLEWINTSGGKGTFTDLLNDARATNVRHLLHLHQDPFMFHQANLRNIDVPSSTVGDQSGQLSLLQIWVETVLQELMRLTTWPVITLKHDDLAVEFTNRMARDACGYALNWNYNAAGNAVTSVTLTANGNTCSVPIPVTVPGPVTVSGATATADQVGSDPLIMWVTLTGQPATLTLNTPVKW
ncbi:hypothetical protein K461DRAFT_326030 [Myriangium duriaei CBS 260.36]|uniref:Extracellular serine-rich protein n=1 Tax=Myriangium duriaei CBS 260.36 TaxID=1168546 RepID=A0A9P4MQ03_9PEZI|nr:hypothetical protein K461DRAFT_326030 [Myriangium duriaei CBS 260.36]